MAGWLEVNYGPAWNMKAGISSLRRESARLFPRRSGDYRRRWGHVMRWDNQGLPCRFAGGEGDSERKEDIQLDSISARQARGARQAFWWSARQSAARVSANEHIAAFKRSVKKSVRQTRLNAPPPERLYAQR
ncbi:hypothetical protein AAFF_G00317090 [Aldrovandia affinis]|uniref:Uncharacterized protein n=1 Tax=Aldrovandia affinis TaxID=143900 RepID=A0AAD7W0B4_9TELE|nr:hypothetical protein AAFF_G00317090 [Aldrovandia affinis]